ncbi:MAG: hypothetical protein KatS3mg028_0912 [Bacteroidia bacterium]|nr:MAG: hypothetical protein KatS3mg028_0912 [Bacteroidia bacterium]
MNDLNHILSNESGNILFFQENETEEVKNKILEKIK